MLSVWSALKDTFSFSMSLNYPSKRVANTHLFKKGWQSFHCPQVFFVLWRVKSFRCLHRVQDTLKMQLSVDKLRMGMINWFKRKKKNESKEDLPPQTIKNKASKKILKQTKRMLSREACVGVVNYKLTTYSNLNSNETNYSTGVDCKISVMGQLEPQIREFLFFLEFWSSSLFQPYYS